MKILAKIRGKQQGATAIEYAIVAFFLSIIILGGLAVIAGGNKNNLNEVGEKLDGAFNKQSSAQ